jgi:DNA-binding transcriptional MocR family regulator
MSFRHMAWAMETKIGDPLAKLLLVALADRADKDTGQCWPSLARLCEDTEMSMATVTRRLHYLEEGGFIRRDQRDQKSTLYTLSLTERPLSLTERPLSLTERTPSLSQRDEPITMNQSENNKDILIEFEEFWSVYPRKVGKGQARTAFKAALRKATKDELVSAVTKYAEQVRGKDIAYIAHASTWLHGERWLDETEATAWGDI